MRLEELDEKLQELIREAEKPESSVKFEELSLAYVTDHEKAFKIEVPLRGLLSEDGSRTFLVEVRYFSDKLHDFL